MNHIAISYGLKETHSFTLHRVPVINVAHNAVHDQFCSLDERGLRLWDTVKGSRNKVTFPIAQKNFIHTLTWVQALNVYFGKSNSTLSMLILAINHQSGGGMIAYNNDMSN